MYWYWDSHFTFCRWSMQTGLGLGLDGKHNNQWSKVMGIINNCAMFSWIISSLFSTSQTQHHHNNNKLFIFQDETIERHKFGHKNQWGKVWCDHPSFSMPNELVPYFAAELIKHGPNHMEVQTLKLCSSPSFKKVQVPVPKNPNAMICKMNDTKNDKWNG